MGEKPLISDGKRHPWSVMGNAYKLSENFDAGVKNLPPPLAPLAGSQSDAILNSYYTVQKI